jgi:hypothetical protein
MDHKGNVYVGGLFNQAGNASAYNIAKWNGSSWEGLGAGLNGYVNTLAVDRQDRLYAGGSFYISGSGFDPGQYSSIFRWNGSQWEDLESGISAMVTLLTFDDEDRLVAGGFFSSAGGITAQGMARWDGQKWEALCDCFLDAPNSILFDGDSIYVGSATIRKIHGGTVELVGGGVGINFPDQKYSAVYAMMMDQKGRLIIGGEFTRAGQVDVQNISRWNGQTWDSLGSGVGPDGVSSISTETNGKLLVAGGFIQAGGKVSRNLAVWTEPNYYWLPLVNR